MRFRLTRAADFPVARSFIPSAYRYAPATRDALPDLWTDLLKAGQLITAVVEASESQAAGQVLGVGLSVFVSDAFVDDLLADPVPYVNARLHDLIRAGESPVLGARQIAESSCNGGLNLLPLHFCTPSVDVRDPLVLRTLSAAQDLFRLMHAGFNVKRVVKEVVNLDLCCFMQSTGMKLACDYSARPEFGLESLPEPERPYLLSVDRDEMPLGSSMSLMFVTTPVRFYFSPAEQKLLLCALLRESDEDIAGDLGLSPDTVRKHWKSVFQRVSDADPGFFMDEQGGSAREGTRGRGKRRHLLRYLQLHMEELRPHGNGRTAGEAPGERRAGCRSVGASFSRPFPRFCGASVGDRPAAKT